jgi:hypothetical protein
MYMNDTQETDIEIRTGDPTHIHFTNQQTHPSIGETTYAVPAPDTMTSAFHEYRYDWLSTGTNFYIDGVFIMTINRNVPSTAGRLMWNSWSNGWAWTFGPPAQENILLIRSVEAYFNRTSVDTSNCEATSGSSEETGTVVTSADAPVTTDAAATSSPLSSSASSSTPQSSTSSSTWTSTTETEASSQTDDGTSIPATQTSLSTRIPIEDTEMSESTMFDDTHTNNTLQAMITTGIASDQTEAPLMEHMRPSVQQLLLRLYTSA